MDLFEFIGTLFNGAAYAQVSEAEKRKHSFMTLRMLSIQYPVEACQFSLNTIQKERLMDFWALFLRRTFVRKPDWLFTKVRRLDAAAKAAKHAVYAVKPEICDEYMFRFRVDPRDFALLQEIDPDGLLAELKILQEFFKDGGKSAIPSS